MSIMTEKSDFIPGIPLHLFIICSPYHLDTKIRQYEQKGCGVQGQECGRPGQGEMDGHTDVLTDSSEYQRKLTPL
ncbi:unnamed protein product [Enterobius vermicularis]|uniref:Uncharacterized protein n=1 Tax=Enterobius vermicularis TaxID=51028 RepID=A0A0N4VHZ1_ENTVE|nr:unnamed protein product [Enterobius vermicularis]